MTYFSSQPQPATQELFRQLSNLIGERHPDQLALLKLKRSAERVKNADPEGAFTLCGGIASLEWDVDMMHRQHRAALNCGGNSALALSNYSVSLAHLGLVSEAADRALEASEREKGDSFFLRNAIVMLMSAGRWQHASNLADEYARLGQDDLPPEARVAMEIASLANLHNLSDNDSALLMNTFFRILHDARVPVSGRLAFNADSSEGISVQCLINATPKETASFNEAFADQAFEISGKAAALTTCFFRCSN